MGDGVKVEEAEATMVVLEGLDDPGIDESWEGICSSPSQDGGVGVEAMGDGVKVEAKAAMVVVGVLVDVAKGTRGEPGTEGFREGICSSPSRDGRVGLGARNKILRNRARQGQHEYLRGFA